jgi:hypothetical protein
LRRAKQSKIEVVVPEEEKAEYSLGKGKMEVKFPLCISIKHMGGAEKYLHSFLKSELNGSERIATRSHGFIPRDDRPGTHSKGGWLAPQPVWTLLKRGKTSCAARTSSQDTVAIQATVYFSVSQPMGRPKWVAKQ